MNDIDQKNNWYLDRCHSVLDPACMVKVKKVEKRVETESQRNTVCVYIRASLLQTLPLFSQCFPTWPIWSKSDDQVIHTKRGHTSHTVSHTVYGQSLFTGSDISTTSIFYG